MTRAHGILECIQDMLNRTKGIKTFKIISTKHGSTLAFITRDDGRGYTLSICPVIIEEVKAEKRLMYSEVMERGGIDG